MFYTLRTQKELSAIAGGNIKSGVFNMKYLKFTIKIFFTLLFFITVCHGCAQNKEISKIWQRGGHTAEVRSVAFSPDGNILASGGYDSIILWGIK